MGDVEGLMRECAKDLASLFEEVGKLLTIVPLGEEGKDAENWSNLDNLTEIYNPEKKLTDCNFPVYGAVKAGKSSMLACILGEKILPERAQAMTSIPIKIQHNGRQGVNEAHLRLKDADKWNKVVRGVAHALKGNELIKYDVEGKEPDGECDVELINVERKIKDQSLKFKELSPKEEIRTELDNISHFVRYCWTQKIRLEEDYDLPITAENLPTIVMNMLGFRGEAEHKEFSLLDTPGPNESKALEALKRIGMTFEFLRCFEVHKKFFVYMC